MEDETRQIVSPIVEHIPVQSLEDVLTSSIVSISDMIIFIVRASITELAVCVQKTGIMKNTSRY